MLSLPERLKGAVLVALACVCWSSGGILVRLVTVDSFTVVCFRSAFMALAVGGALVVLYGRRAPVRIRAVGWPGCLAAVLLSGAFIFYILAIRNTQVANALIVMSISPLIAAVLGRIVLGERLGWHTPIAIAVALAGIGVMVGDAFGTVHVLGEAFAFGVALCFGVNIVVLRRQRAIDMVPATFLAGLLSALVTLPLADPGTAKAQDLAILAVLGFFQLGLGLFLFTRGTRYLKAAEVGLLTLLETVLAPIWVWLFIAERPAASALIGGGLVLAALAGQALAANGRPGGEAAPGGPRAEHPRP
jgi:drug/metabolite transporter (DMT)-like permease